jgi:hypothetical protein
VWCQDRRHQIRAFVAGTHRSADPCVGPALALNFNRVPDGLNAAAERCGAHRNLSHSTQCREILNRRAEASNPTPIRRSVLGRRDVHCAFGRHRPKCRFERVGDPIRRRTRETGMPSTWNIHYARWIIDDGEPEREVGDHFLWELLLYHSAERMTHSATRELSVLEADDYSYDVVAKIVHLSPTASLIDFGLTAFGAPNLVPRQCEIGDYVTGRIKLSFVHYCYPSVPAQIRESMSHHWSAEAVLADLTSYSHADEAEKRFIRDSQNAKYEPVKSTREKNVQDYILQCCQLHGE